MKKTISSLISTDLSLIHHENEDQIVIIIYEAYLKRTYSEIMYLNILNNQNIILMKIPF
jgi:hypothetical protein